MKFIFQRAMIGSINRLFTYIETHTLGNHTAKSHDVEFMKSWETQRLDMSMQAQTTKQLQYVHEILAWLTYQISRFVKRGVRLMSRLG